MLDDVSRWFAYLGIAAIALGVVRACVGGEQHHDGPPAIPEPSRGVVVELARVAR